MRRLDQRRERSVPQRTHDEPARGLLSLDVRLDVTAILEVLMDHLALQGAHRLKGDRAAAADRSLSGLVGGGPEDGRAALAVPGRIHHYRDPVTVPRHREAIGQMLDRVDRLTVVTDEQT